MEGAFRASLEGGGGFVLSTAMFFFLYSVHVVETWDSVIEAADNHRWQGTEEFSMVSSTLRRCHITDLRIDLHRCVCRMMVEEVSLI